MIHDLNNLISITWRGTCLVIMKQSSPMSLVKNFYEPSTSKYRNRFSMKQLQLYGFLLLVLLPSTMSIPLRGKRSSTDKLARSDEKTPWVNPCAGASTEAKYENNCTENIFFGSVIQSGKLAIYDAKQFVENYVNETFNVNLEDHHNQFKKNSLPWLKPDNVEIPKELGEVVSQEHLKKLKLEDVAVDIYEYLQHMAVAFRQVVEDHREQNSKFKENFSTAETSLKALLREMREFIPESKLALFDNAKQEIMPPTYRHMKDHTFKPVRDWLIFRDYMNLVEYIVQVMEYFVKKIEIVD